MADEKRNYPQIPTRVWWGVREMIQNRPSAKLTDSILATQLSVQQSAAKAYLSQFKAIGLIDEEGSATKLANKWRNDATYEDSKLEILNLAYPKELVDSFPPSDADVQKVAGWFQIGGLGSGTAKNKAATYVLIANSKPEDAATGPARDRSPSSKAEKEKPSKDKDRGGKARPPKGDQVSELPALNVNVQIHISADASNDQIEAIFAAMNKYLRA